MLKRYKIDQGLLGRLEKLARITGSTLLIIDTGIYIKKGNLIQLGCKAEQLLVEIKEETEYIENNSG